MRPKIIISLFLVSMFIVPVMEMGGGAQLTREASAQAAGSPNPDPAHIQAQSGNTFITVYPLGLSSTPATGTITCVPGGSILDGATIILKNYSGNIFTYEFDNNGSVTGTNIPVSYNSTMSAADVGQALAAKMLPTFVNGSWAGPRITLSVSGPTLYLTQGKSGVDYNYPITGTAQSNGFTFSGFARGVNDDRVNIQWAFNNVAPGGTVMLKATDLIGNPRPFDLGKFEYFLYVFPAAGMNSRTQPNLNNHRVFIDRSMTVQGETVAGHKTTIKNGFETFAIGLNSTPTGPGPITIDGIRFQDAGYAPIYAEQSFIPITITHNTITNHLSDLFAGKAKPGWDSTQPNNWGNPEDGTHITMLQFHEKGHPGTAHESVLFGDRPDALREWAGTDEWHPEEAREGRPGDDGCVGDGYTFTDVTGSYTKADRVAAFLTAAASMNFDSSVVYTTDGNGQNVPYYGLWFAPGIFLSNAYGAQGLLTVPLNINSNDITQNEMLPSRQFTPVWYEDIGIITSGHRTFDSYILENTIHNVSSGGITVLDDTGHVTIQGNTIEVGPAGAYHSRNALLPPRTGASAIMAAYNLFSVYQYPPNTPSAYPTIGGDVSILANTVTNKSRYSKDAGGIWVTGDNSSFFNSVAIEGNLVQIRNGRHGISIDASDVPGVSGSLVRHNTVTGSGFSGILLGLAPGVPKDAADVTVTDIDLRGFQATSAGTSNPGLPAAYVYLGSDTHDNIGTKICVPADTTYSQFIQDYGTNNDFKPSCSPIAMTGYLIERVKHFNLQHGIENSLETKLRNTLGSLRPANAEHRQHVTNTLTSFIYECQAQSGKKLTVGQAGELMAYASEIIATLEAGH